MIKLEAVFAGCNWGGGGRGLMLPAGPMVEGLIIVVTCCATDDGPGGAYDGLAADCDCMLIGVGVGGA